MIDFCTFATLTDGLHGIKCIHGMASFGHAVQSLGLGLDMWLGYKFVSRLLHTVTAKK